MVIRPHGPRNMALSHTRPGGRKARAGAPPAGVDLVAAVRLVPLREGSGLEHLFDDLPPADARVVRAEGDLSHLGRVRDDAHFRAPEVVVEEALDPTPPEKNHTPSDG